MSQKDFKYGDQFKSVRETGAREGTVVGEVTNPIPEAVGNIGWPMRSIESVLADMRRVLDETPVNHDLLKSLITESEVYAARMVGAISDIDEFDSLERRYRSLKKEVAEMEAKLYDSTTREIM